MRKLIKITIFKEKKVFIDIKFLNYYFCGNEKSPLEYISNTHTHTHTHPYLLKF